MSDFLKQLELCGARVQTDVPLASFTSFHIGGNAAFFVTVESEGQLLCVLEVARREGVSVCVLGGGSNVLISDDGFSGLVINMQIVEVSFESNLAHVGAGVITAQLAGQCVAHGFAGMEWAVGIPGRIGGAIVGNAGAMGGEIKDIIVRVRSVDVVTGEIHERSGEACDFSYRESIFKRLHEVIISCDLLLTSVADVINLQEVLRDNLRYRNSTQPKRYGSSGCMFKNYVPRDHDIARLALLGIPQTMLDARRISTGMLVDRAGCKGMRVGDAEVSQDHGNFVINRGRATATDVRELVQRVKSCVHKMYGIDIEEEVRFIGF